MSEYNELPVIPECKVPATVDPSGLIRFELSEQQAEDIYDTVKENYDTASSDEDLVSVPFVMDQEAYLSFADGVGQLIDNLPQVGMAQVHLTNEPAYALTVVVDQHQLEATEATTEKTIEETPGDELIGQEFHVPETAALILIRQFEHAFDGASNPVDAVDMDTLREEVATK